MRRFPAPWTVQALDASYSSLAPLVTVGLVLDVVVMGLAGGCGGSTGRTNGQNNPCRPVMACLDHWGDRPAIPLPQTRPGAGVRAKHDPSGEALLVDPALQGRPVANDGPGL